MKIKTGGISLLIIIFMLFPFGNQVCNAQEKKQSLLFVLEQIEELFEVRFSYATQDIENIEVNTPDYTNTLNFLLETLNKTTGLQFRFIDGRYITITRYQEDFIDICGILIDAETLFPLEGATIQIQETSQTTITNSTGNFVMQNVPKKATIQISYVGYYTYRSNSFTFQESNPCNTLKLKPEISELQDVVLQNIFAKGIQKNKDGAITLNVENFGNLPGLTEPDVLLMIQSLPGIISADETVSNINIRGGTTDENLILWDDIRMFQNGHFFGLISAFNPYLTKKITLYKNGTNARYGESVSGVVAMHSANDIPEEISGGVQLNMINIGAFAEIPVSNKLGLYVSGRRSIIDFIETPTYNQFFNRIFQNTEVTNLQNTSETGIFSTEEDFSFYDINLKAIYKATNKDSFHVNFLNIDNQLSFTETFSTEITQNSETSDLNQNSLAGGISWNRNWSDKLSTNALVYNTYYILKASNLDVFSNQQLFQSNEVLETGVKLDASLHWVNNNTFTTGYQFTETGISNTQDVNIPRFRSFVKEVLRNHSFFVSNTFNILSSNTSITAGVRTNYFPKFSKLLIEPRLNVHQKLGNGFAIETTFEQKSQSITQRIDLQSDFLGVEKRRWVLANEDNVPIENSNQFSLGLLYQKNNWLIQLEGFLKKVDGITTANQGFQNQLQFVRTIGSYEAQGIEFILNKKTKNWSTWLSYTYTSLDYTFKELIPSNFPHNANIPHQATLATSYSWNKIKISSGISWHSGKPNTVPLNENAIEIINSIPSIQYANPNQEQLDDYFRVDISAEYSFSISKNIEGKINAAVLNVTDRKNILNTYFAIVENNQAELTINQIDQNSLGLTPNISLQILF
ncbi:MAG: hypothetical protein COS19_06310 [Flavobacteriaceae bacterium CG02_land_8_20_14_3_00_34_13]|nr:MAG: hypothetical protein COS19_06310 [Flavobacteriaceae bacterium CG02_land_8_20_14_3_00_34_13]